MKKIYSTIGLLAIALAVGVGVAHAAGTQSSSPIKHASRPVVQSVAPVSDTTTTALVNGSVQVTEVKTFTVAQETAILNAQIAQLQKQATTIQAKITADQASLAAL